MEISVIFRQKPKFVILGASEVSKNGKFSFNLCGFFCCGLRLATRWVATLKMTRRAKRFKKLKKQIANKKLTNEREREREREREVPHPNTTPFFPCRICRVAKFSPHAQPPRSKALRYDDTKRLHNLLAKFIPFEFMTLKL